jgi:hypothetical protein
MMVLFFLQQLDLNCSPIFCDHLIKGHVQTCSPGLRGSGKFKLVRALCGIYKVQSCSLLGN